MIVSTTIASVIAFAGRATTPETEIFVEVSEVAIKLVAVAFVKTPVLGVVAPIEELLIVPPLTVNASVTNASVMLFDGKPTTPVTDKLVLVTLVPSAVANVKLETLPLVEVTETWKALVEVTMVPLAAVKTSGPLSVPPTSGK